MAAHFEIRASSPESPPLGDVDGLKIKGVAGSEPVPVTTIGTAPGIAVAASQTNYALQSSAGAIGDYLAVLMIVPGTTSPGAVTFKDGSGSSVTAFPGGASSVTTLHPVSFIVNAISASGAWSVTTGANVTVWASGKFA